MKKILLFILLFTSINVIASNYYFSSSGDDSRTSTQAKNPATPWKTISKLNSFFSSLAAGDSVLFKRGDTFYGTITVSKSGTSGNPIVISAYGTGDKPVITGFSTLTSWTNEGGNIYSAAITSEAQANMVLVDGTQVAMGRYPNTGTNLTYESHSGTSSITDNQLTGTIWTGAEIVINKNDWVLDRCLVTDHSTTTLTYTNLGSSDEPENNRYYFIQNSLAAVDITNEWYHSTSASKFYIYGNPEAKIVQAATLNYLVNINTKSYITVAGLSFIGSINSAVYMPYGSNTVNVTGCDITFAGRKAIYFDGTSNCIFSNNTISNCNEAGFFGYSDNNHVTITGNTISNIGLLPGQAFYGTHSEGVYTYGLSNNSLITYNNISNTAYNGIYFIGTNVSVSYNFINYPMMLLDDGGGIYTNGSNSGRVINGNIILNSGVGGYDNNLCCGIYNDSGGDNLVVTNNTIANCVTEGIKNNLGSSNTYTGNTLYNNLYGFYLTEWNSNYGSVTGLYITRNKVVSKSASQQCLYIYFDANNITGLGTMDSNYYARPIDDNQTIRTYQPSTGYVNRALTSWQSFFGQEANSHKSPITITDTTGFFHFLYNTTSEINSYILSDTMHDVSGTEYSDTLFVNPYSSIVLLGTGNVSSEGVYADTTIPVITSFSIPALSESLTVSVSSFSATDDVGVTGYILTESSSPPGLSDPRWSESSPTSFTFTSRGDKTLYAWVKDLPGNISEPLNDSVLIYIQPETRGHQPIKSGGKIVKYNNKIVIQ